MDDKERELVNENTCCSNNPMCYNVVVGGCGGNKVRWTLEKRKHMAIQNRKH